MAVETSYYDRLIEHIQVQAERRGIPEDGLGDLKEKLEEKYGKLTEVPDRKLRQIQQELDAFLTEYIGGAKRVSELGQEEEVREEWLP